MQLHLSGVGFEALQKKLNVLSSPEFGTDVLDQGLAIFLNRIRTRFRSELGPDNAPWTPSLAGLIRKSGKFTYRNGKKYTATGTLFETGNLWHSIQAFDTGKKDTRGIATDVVYAKYLQKDLSTGPWVFMASGDDDMTVFERLVLKRVVEALNG